MSGKHLHIARSVPLKDIEIGPDGRTVTAYAATFDYAYPVVDREGSYDEEVARTAFNRAIGRGIERVGVLYNHGVTAWGTPSEVDSVPVGQPLEIKPDGHGLLTVTRYGTTARAEEVLQSIKDETVRFMSFRGPVYQSDPVRYVKGRPTIRRTELGLKEYGPTPFPANERAAIIAVRSTATDNVSWQSWDASGRFTPRQVAQAQHDEQLAMLFGKYTQDSSPDGAHYMPVSPFASEGLACANCAFYEGSRTCEIVDGDIAPEALCKRWVIPADLLSGDAARAATLVPPLDAPIEKVTDSGPSPDDLAAASAQAETSLRLISAMRRR